MITVPGTLNTSNRQLRTRFRDIASSGDLNEFNEGVVRDVAELFDSVSNALLTSKRLEDVLSAQLAALHSVVSSMSGSGVVDKVTVPVKTSSDYELEVYGVAELPGFLQGAASFSLVSAYIPENVYQLVVGDDEEVISTVRYGRIAGLSPLFDAIRLIDPDGMVVEYWDDLISGWHPMTVTDTGVPATINDAVYLSADAKLLVLADHVDNQAIIRMRTVSSLVLTQASLLEVVSDITKYYVDQVSNVLVVNQDMVILIGQGFAYLDAVPLPVAATLNAPADKVTVDFFTKPNIWATTSARLANMTHNARYRLLTDPAFCHHDSLYGQITLPYTSEQDKCLVKSMGDVFLPDTLKVTTRIFRIHDKPINGDHTKRYFNILNEAKGGSPFELQRMLDNAASTELSTPDIIACFEQTDPLYAIDGDATTPAWYLTPFVDVDDALGTQTWPGTTHLVVFYDIEMPQDINPHMFFNTVQIHTMPIYRAHLIDMRYNVGAPFSDEELGQQFRMDSGSGANLQGYPIQSWQQNVSYQPADGVFGQNENIFWNAGFLEFHVKRTEANFLRLVFATEYSPAMAFQRRMLLGATHVGVYHRDYKTSGTFKIEFEEETGFYINSLSDSTRDWVNNKYALFNPDPSQEPRFAEVNVAGNQILEVNFGVRTDDLSGTIQQFDNSATPSFSKITMR